ncbi:MAG: hypothetical protein ACFB9M_21465 [Myxococcota bacterium]
MAREAEGLRPNVDAPDEPPPRLRLHHDRDQSIWLVSWEKANRGPRILRRDVFRALLSYGGIESIPRRFDNDRTLLLVSRGRQGASWPMGSCTIAEQLIQPGERQVRGRSRSLGRRDRDVVYRMG